MKDYRRVDIPEKERPLRSDVNLLGTLLAGVHTIVLGLLTAAAVSGQIRRHWPRLSRYLIISTVLTIALFGGLRLFFEVVVPQEYRAYEKLVQMDLAVERVDSRIVLPGEA